MDYEGMLTLTPTHFGILILLGVFVGVVIAAVGRGLWRLGLLAAFALRRGRRDGGSGSFGGGGDGGGS